MASLPPVLVPHQTAPAAAQPPLALPASWLAACPHGAGRRLAARLPAQEGRFDAEGCGWAHGQSKTAAGDVRHLTEQQAATCCCAQAHRPATQHAVTVTCNGCKPGTRQWHADGHKRCNQGSGCWHQPSQPAGSVETARLRHADGHGGAPRPVALKILGHCEAALVAQLLQRLQWRKGRYKACSALHWQPRTCRTAARKAPAAEQGRQVCVHATDRQILQHCTVRPSQHTPARSKLGTLREDVSTS